MKIYISSLAFSERDIEEIGQMAQMNNFSIEFTANFEPEEDLVSKFKALKITRLAHNYFPPPKSPFVLNLASENREIRSRSLEHCENGIKLAAETGTRFFSAHAGFCIDPKPDELGKKIEQPAKLDRDMHWSIFLECCCHLAEEAQENGVNFYVENNVLSPQNMREDGVVPLLCVEPDEIIRMLDEVANDHLGFLLDTAHLKVSANTLNFSLEEAAEKLVPFTGYIHHSDNNGMADSNQALTDDYWFLPFMTLTKGAIHVLEVRDQTIEQLQHQTILLKYHSLE